jgi:hypothetical protein
VYHHPFTTLPHNSEAGIDNQWNMQCDWRCSASKGIFFPVYNKAVLQIDPAFIQILLPDNLSIPLIKLVSIKIIFAQYNYRMGTKIRNGSKNFTIS